MEMEENLGICGAEGRQSILRAREGIGRYVSHLLPAGGTELEPKACAGRLTLQSPLGMSLFPPGQPPRPYV